MADDDFIRAGAVILNDLLLFNQAVNFLENQISPMIQTAVGEFVGDWIQRNFWTGDADASDSLTDIWLCPTAWQESGDRPFARFHFARRDDDASDSYEIADLLNLGQTDFGFRFAPEHSWFGGKNKWNAFARNISDLTERVAKAGWINEGKGVFFRPVSLAVDCRVSAWENEDWSATLAPLTVVLDSLAADQKLFDNIIMRAGPKTA